MNIKDNNGFTHRVECDEYVENETIGVWINNVYHRLKAYYRNERTWDDHMGNTPCGYYVIAPLFKQRKRIYLSELCHAYR